MEKNIYSFFTSNDTQMKDLFDIKKVSLLLKLFDEKRYNEFCCIRYASIFKDNSNNVNKGEDTNYDMNYSKKIKIILISFPRRTN